MGSVWEIKEEFNNLASVLAAEEARIDRVLKSQAEKAVGMMAERAPRSEINEAGYVHFYEQFRYEQIAAYNYGIINDKIVNGYELWKLLENGTPKMAPRPTVGPVMDIIGPETLRLIGEFEIK